MRLYDIGHFGWCGYVSQILVRKKTRSFKGSSMKFRAFMENMDKLAALAYEIEGIFPFVVGPTGSCSGWHPMQVTNLSHVSMKLL